MEFDIDGARKAGYEDSEIADYLGSQNSFDVTGARKSGYEDGEIISHLSKTEPSGLLRRGVGDPLVGVAQGLAVGIPQTALGLLNIPTLGRAGKLAETVEEKTGFGLKRANQFFEDLKTPEMQESIKKVSEAKGFLPTVTEAVQNPAAIVDVVAQSLSPMKAGAMITAKVFGKAGMGVFEKGITVAERARRAAITGGVAEGAVTAGQNLEQVRSLAEGGVLTPGQVAINTISGAITGAIGVAGGKLARRMGLPDADTIMVDWRSGVLGTNTKDVFKKMLYGAVKEGAFEELPQSMQEQVAQNISLGKPIDDNVLEQGALGMLAGFAQSSGLTVSSQLLGKLKPSNPVIEQLKADPIEKERQGIIDSDPDLNAMQKDIEIPVLELAPAPVIGEKPAVEETSLPAPVNVGQGELGLETVPVGAVEESTPGAKVETAPAEIVESTPTLGGKPTLYRGSGRENAGAAYNEFTDQKALLGNGQFWALNEKDAKVYGPDVESKPMPEFSNPLTVKDDAKWGEIVRTALAKDDSGTDRISYPNPFGLSPEKMAIWRKGVSDYLKENGHDALIVDMDAARGDDAKTLRNVFGHSQVFIPEGVKSPSPLSEVGTKAPVDMAATRIQAKSRLSENGIPVTNIADTHTETLSSLEEHHKAGKVTTAFRDAVKTVVKNFQKRGRNAPIQFAFDATHTLSGLPLSYPTDTEEGQTTLRNAGATEEDLKNARIPGSTATRHAEINHISHGGNGPIGAEIIFYQGTDPTVALEELIHDLQRTGELTSGPAPKGVSTEENEERHASEILKRLEKGESLDQIILRDRVRAKKTESGSLFATRIQTKIEKALQKIYPIETEQQIIDSARQQGITTNPEPITLLKAKAGLEKSPNVGDLSAAVWAGSSAQWWYADDAKVFGEWFDDAHRFAGFLSAYSPLSPAESQNLKDAIITREIITNKEKKVGRKLTKREIKKTIESSSALGGKQTGAINVALGEDLAPRKTGGFQAALGGSELRAVIDRWIARITGQGEFANEEGVPERRDFVTNDFLYSALSDRITAAGEIIDRKTNASQASLWGLAKGVWRIIGDIRSGKKATGREAMKNVTNLEIAKALNYSLAIAEQYRAGGSEAIDSLKRQGITDEQLAALPTAKEMLASRGIDPKAKPFKEATKPVQEALLRIADVLEKAWDRNRSLNVQRKMAKRVVAGKEIPLHVALETSHGPLAGMSWARKEMLHKELRRDILSNEAIKTIGTRFGVQVVDVVDGPGMWYNSETNSVEGNPNYTVFIASPPGNIDAEYTNRLRGFSATLAHANRQAALGFVHPVVIEEIFPDGPILGVDLGGVITNKQGAALTQALVDEFPENTPFFVPTSSGAYIVMSKIDEKYPFSNRDFSDRVHLVLDKSLRNDVKEIRAFEKDVFEGGDYYVSQGYDSGTEQKVPSFQDAIREAGGPGAEQYSRDLLSRIDAVKEKYATEKVRRELRRAQREAGAVPGQPPERGRSPGVAEANVREAKYATRLLPRQEGVRVKIALQKDPSAGAVPEFKNKDVTLTHWSKIPDLKQTDPTKHGTGYAGAEMFSKNAHPELWIPKTYAGYGTYKAEPGVGAHRYEITTPGNKLYDIWEDPLRLSPSDDEVRKLGYNTHNAKKMIHEQRIKAAGFSGFASSPYNVAALFEGVPVTKVENSGDTLPQKETRYATRQDATYLKAVEKGDMATAQKMVNEAAKRHLGNVISRIKVPDVESGNCGSFAIALADMIGKDKVRYVFVENSAEPERYYHVAVEYAGKIYDGTGEVSQSHLEYMGFDEDKKYGVVSITRYPPDNSFDRSILRNTDYTVDVETITRQFEEILSPVTRDTNGNIIPLSERFNEKTPDTRYATRPTGQNLMGPNWDVPQSSTLSDIVYTFIDKFEGLRAIEKAISNFAGTIHDTISASLKEVLYSGRVGEGVADFLADEMKPIYKAIGDNGLTLDGFEVYLHNRHAIEANEYVRSIGGLQDKGSGITDRNATDYLANLDPVTKAKYERIAQRVDAVTKRNAELLVAYGLETQETIDKWFAKYKAYVPLFREHVDYGIGSMGTGFSIIGAASKGRKGSETKVVDILANIKSQREKVITRGEKNIIAKAIYAMAKRYPNADFWKIAKPTIVTTTDVDTGNEVRVPSQRYKTADNVLMHREEENGKIVEKGVEFNTQNERGSRLVGALKNIDADTLGFLLGNSAKVTRFIASMNTQYNPVFGITNFIRDMGTAMFNLSTTPIQGKQQKVLKYSLPALKGIYDAIRAQREGRTTGSIWESRWNDFRRRGGKTGYRDLFKTTAEATTKIEDEINRLQTGSKIFKGGYAIKDLLSDYNTAMENSIRLSAYQVGVENGMTPDRAAEMAKGLTVNFNRKGQIATQAGALYAFFNASAQGSARMLETLSGPMGKKILMGGVTLGVLQAALLAAAGFGDDEPPEFVQERNIIIPTGGKNYVTIPMPLGFHVIPNIGRVMAQYAMGGFKDPSKKFAGLFSTMFESFNPMGASGISLQTITPTALDPLAALAENKDWTGKPIYREDFSSLSPTPGFTRAKDSASYFGQGLAWVLNKLSGGTAYVPGYMSPTPDAIDYFTGQLTGGVGREAGKALQTGLGLVTGEEIPTYRVPLLSRFYGSAEGKAVEKTKFYENIKLMNRHGREIEGRREHQGDVAEYMKDNPEAKYFRMAKHTQNTLDRLNKRKRLMEEKNSSKGSIKAIDNVIATHIKKFNNTIQNAKG